MLNIAQLMAQMTRVLAMRLGVMNISLNFERQGDARSMICSEKEDSL
jgi:hypothetical protein